MKASEIKIGKRVIYHPIIGDPKGRPAVIESEVYDICGSQCCMIDIRSGVVDIESLEDVK